jgi:hypothetical protein
MHNFLDLEYLKGINKLVVFEISTDLVLFGIVT